jgi:hypothetical protein
VFVIVELNREGAPTKVVHCYDRRTEAEAMLPLFLATGRAYDVRPWGDIEDMLNQQIPS